MPLPPSTKAHIRNSPGTSGQSYSKKSCAQPLVRTVFLPYHSPHKFRHGHAVYALKNAKTVPDLKAVSQNLMHTNLSITDGVYGILSEKDVKEKIVSLGREILSDNKIDYELLTRLLKNALKQLDDRSN